MLSNLAFSALALAGIAAAAPSLERRVGPSGTVQSPAGGSTWSSTQGYPDGKIHLVYQPVNLQKSGNCAYFSCDANTLSISATLQSDSGSNYPLASYLTPAAAGQNIDVWLGYPEDLCGNYRLIVQETQNLYGQIITFQSAAPSIQLNCDQLP